LVFPRLKLPHILWAVARVFQDFHLPTLLQQSHAACLLQSKQNLACNFVFQCPLQIEPRENSRSAFLLSGNLKIPTFAKAASQRNFRHLLLSSNPLPRIYYFAIFSLHSFDNFLSQTV